MIAAIEPTRLDILEKLADNNGGILRPEDVIEAARPESSPLHDAFTWDDTDAAHQYRMWQARQLIRVSVRYLDRANGQERVSVRAFVSLTPDRSEDGGGYRHISAVMSHKGMRRQMLDDALEELQVFERKYASLNELADVFSASRKARLLLKV